MNKRTFSYGDICAIVALVCIPISGVVAAITIVSYISLLLWGTIINKDGKISQVAELANKLGCSEGEIIERFCSSLRNPAVAMNEKEINRKWGQSELEGRKVIVPGKKAPWEDPTT